ncbi:putative tryptophan transport protein [Clostridium pasteurianum DSM 525 = ATCC 6013]|uniref:Putative tryptophan transport protein n=1 Tax=Clostridium pasteurianum DSM 525 = ATCC 6013 TaxID=1262449 RepID=A0A0H3J4W7_CLOPA|nr:tryptophan transporter [Clostridium pasteurianum]AJA48549.1 putative tryptophan transport protein [Clostridium pasteurianum DSM 525 = ATCC 6013]AJA52537.1 putative tryptophan transport protein [Clostridium pasteurianum DSM 525 = ATCC 6013]AOZ75785.1 tryptophan transporter [Clostridium pasteurianum DSM 525 = ATCC 6013]AOZ79581.1 tryptophan transporter [Clostridium pasteurianum]ELP57970.1 tryptophan transport protein [Clostridium pasteurianum DSM 525 = ATCC 6013]
MSSKNNLRKLVTIALLLAIGMVLYQITPPFVMGMRPNFLLAMMFIAIILADDYKLTILIGLVSGIYCAIISTFPGGQVGNIVDKLITCQVVFLMFRAMKNRVPKQIMVAIIGFVCTAVSGTVFLIVASIVAGLPSTFTALVLSVVVPATIINTVVSIILYNAVNVSLKYSGTYR